MLTVHQLRVAELLAPVGTVFNSASMRDHLSGNVICVVKRLGGGEYEFRMRTRRY